MAIKVIDWRKNASWQDGLATDMLVFQEEKADLSYVTYDRMHLEKSDRVVIAEMLDSPVEWSRFLEKTQPEVIYLVFDTVKHYTLKEFLAIFWQRLKAIEKEGADFLSPKIIAKDLRVSQSLVVKGLEYFNRSRMIYYQRQLGAVEFYLMPKEKRLHDLYMYKKVHQLLLEREAFLRYLKEADIKELEKSINGWYDSK